MRTLLLAASLVVLFTAPVFATSRAQCRAACGPQIALECGGLPRFIRCSKRVIRQCRLLGVANGCPTQQAVPTPPPPPTTTTTLPPPPVAVVPDLIGAYQFSGPLVEDPCGMQPIGNLPTTLTSKIAVTAQAGTSLTATMGIYPASGEYVASGEWTLTTVPYVQAGCTLTARLVVDSVSLPTGGSMYVDANCPTYGFDCSLLYKRTGN